MKEQLIRKIRTEMSDILTEKQSNKLHDILLECFSNIKIEPLQEEEYIQSNIDYLKLYISAKSIEGCSKKTLTYYETTIRKMIAYLEKDIREITTAELRLYLADYQKIHNASKVTIDNVRRILSGFFAWLEDEDYILKSPARRIHKIKAAQIIKEAFSDESLEILKSFCTNARDLALVEFLASTGVRVGEVVRLNRQDINFSERSCIVFVGNC